MKSILFGFTFILLTCLACVCAQDPSASVEKPVVLKGDLKAIEAIREASQKHIEAWREGSGKFLVESQGKSYAVRAEWSDGTARIEVTLLQKDAKLAEIDWGKPAELTWIQNARKQFRYDAKARRLEVFLDQPDSLFGAEHLQVVPNRRFAHHRYGVSWDESLDPKNQKCAKNCEYTAKKTEKEIVITTKSDDGGSGEFIATADANWLITNILGAGARSQIKQTFAYKIDSKGIAIPTRFEKWIGPKDKEQPATPTSLIEVIDLKRDERVAEDRFDFPSLVIPPGTGITVMDQNGGILLHRAKAVGQDIANLAGVIDAHLNRKKE